MLTIYHVPRTRSLRVIWLCEEMGVPYEVKTEVFGQPSPEFLEANPLGAFPGIRDGDVLMGESTAIMQYVAETYGPTPLALTKEHPRFADYLQFVTFGEASLAAYMNPVIATQFMAPEGQTAKCDRGPGQGHVRPPAWRGREEASRRATTLPATSRPPTSPLAMRLAWARTSGWPTSTRADQGLLRPGDVAPGLPGRGGEVAA